MLVPNVASLKSLNGLENLIVPAFGFSMATGRQPMPSDLKMVTFRHTNASLFHLMPNGPGAAFIIKLSQPRDTANGSKLEESPQLVTLAGELLRGGFSLKRICQLKANEPSFPLSTIIGMLFPAFDLTSVKLPESLSSFAHASILQFSINSANKVAQFTVDLGQTHLLKGILPNQSLAESGQTLLSLSIGYHTKPFTWSMNATCTGTFFGLNGTAYIRSLWIGFEISFEATHLSIMNMMSTSSSGGIGAFLKLIRQFDLLDLPVQQPKIKIITKPITVYMSGSIKVGRLLPILHCQFLGQRLFSNKSTFMLQMESGAARLSSVVKTFLGFDINQVPFFGSLQLPGLTMMLMPEKLNLTNMGISDVIFSPLAMREHASRHSLLLTIPIRFKVGLLNVTSALNSSTVDLHMKEHNVSLVDVLQTVLPNGLGITKLPTFIGPVVLERLHVNQLRFIWKSQELLVQLAYTNTVHIARNIVSLTIRGMELRYASGSFKYSISSDVLLMNATTMRASVTKSGEVFHCRMHALNPISLHKLIKERPHMLEMLNATHESSLVLQDASCEIEFSDRLQLHYIFLTGLTMFDDNHVSNMTLFISIQQQRNTSQSNSNPISPLLFTACLQHSNVTNIVQRFSGYDVSKIPSIGQLKADQVTVFGATGELVMPKTRLQGCGGDMHHTTFHEGFAFSLNITNQGEQSQITLQPAGRQLKILVQNLPLPSSIRLFFPAFTQSMLQFPEGFPPINSMAVRYVLFKDETQEAAFVIYLGSFKLPNNTPTCKNIGLEVIVHYAAEPYNYTYMSACAATLLLQDAKPVGVTAMPEKSTPVQTPIQPVTAVPEKLSSVQTPIKDASLTSILSRDGPPDSNFMKLLSEFNLLNNTVRNVTLKSRHQSDILTVNGKIRLGQTGDAQLEYVVKKVMNKPERIASLGLVLSDINISKLFQTLFKKACFTSFPSIGNVILDEVRLLVLPKTTLSLQGMEFADKKLDKLLHVASQTRKGNFTMSQLKGRKNSLVSPRVSMATNASSVAPLQTRSILRDRDSQLACLLSLKISNSVIDIRAAISHRIFECYVSKQYVTFESDVCMKHSICNTEVRTDCWKLLNAISRQLLKSRQYSFANTQYDIPLFDYNC